jgi:hypothetical protein
MQQAREKKIAIENRYPASDRRTEEDRTRQDSCFQIHSTFLENVEKVEVNRAQKIEIIIFN